MRNALGFILLMSALGLPGVGVLCFGVYEAVDLGRFLLAAHEATGEVIDFTALRSDEDGATYKLVVEYSVRADSPRRLTAETRNPNYAAGHTVPVLYTNEPPEGRVRGIRTTWEQPIIFVAAGAAWSGFAIFFLVIPLRHNRHTSERVRET